jgi:hypothetical protein
MHVLSNQVTHIIWMCRNHEMRGCVDRGERRTANALAE